MQRLIIQQKICDVVDASKFFEVLYTPGTGKPIAYDALVAPVIPPDTVRVNELNTRYAHDKDYGRKEILKQVTWTFALFLEWNNKEIDLSHFEDVLMHSIPIIDGTNEFRSVRLYVLSKDVVHPVQQGATTGTQVKFLFQAELGRF